MNESLYSCYGHSSKIALSLHLNDRIGTLESKLDQIFTLLNDKLKLFLSISLGIYLFILFFQPFPIERFDFNNSLLFVAGLAAIIFFFLIIVRVVISTLMNRISPNSLEYGLPPYISVGFFTILNSVAFAFYLRYVGFVSISFFIMFKIVILSLVPPLILAFYDELKELRHQNETLLIEKKFLSQQVEKYEEDILNKPISFTSENNTESLTLLIAEVALIKSADNYVEIVYKEGDSLKKKLIRNTLKNVYLQISQYSNFIRCHRICIVNIHYIEKLNRNFNNHWLSIKGYHEQIPVSRQYILKLKDAL